MEGGRTSFEPKMVILQCLLPFQYIRWDSGDSATQIILIIQALEQGVGQRIKGRGKELNQKLES